VLGVMNGCEPISELLSLVLPSLATWASGAVSASAAWTKRLRRRLPAAASSRPARRRRPSIQRLEDVVRHAQPQPGLAPLPRGVQLRPMRSLLSQISKPAVRDHRSLDPRRLRRCRDQKRHLSVYWQQMLAPQGHLSRPLVRIRDRGVSDGAVRRVSREGCMPSSKRPPAPAPCSSWPGWCPSPSASSSPCTRHALRVKSGCVAAGILLEGPRRL